MFDTASEVTRYSLKGCRKGGGVGGEREGRGERERMRRGRWKKRRKEGRGKRRKGLED